MDICHEGEVFFQLIVHFPSEAFRGKSNDGKKNRLTHEDGLHRSPLQEQMDRLSYDSELRKTIGVRDGSCWPQYDKDKGATMKLFGEIQFLSSVVHHSIFHLWIYHLWLLAQ